MKRRAFLVLVLAALVLIPACGGGGGGGDSNSIVGSWSLIESGGRPATGWIITFNADGTGRWYIPAYSTTISGTYTASGGYYALYVNGRLIETGTYAVDGNYLTLCGANNCNRYVRI